jgi:hypothetical protein
MRVYCITLLALVNTDNVQVVLYYPLELKIRKVFHMQLVYRDSPINIS